MSKPTHDWVRRAKCGCVTSITYDDPSAASTVAEWIKDGYKVDKMPVSEAVAALRAECPHGNPGQNGQLSLPLSG